jgi:hypothetical protein
MVADDVDNRLGISNPSLYDSIVSFVTCSASQEGDIRVRNCALQTTDMKSISRGNDSVSAIEVVRVSSRGSAFFSPSAAPSLYLSQTPVSDIGALRLEESEDAVSMGVSNSSFCVILTIFSTAASAALGASRGRVIDLQDRHVACRMTIRMVYNRGAKADDKFWSSTLMG